ncbi:hypothetical protein [Rhizobium sp. NXC24]|uniref:hypothetical protein n=1 Tax=Rhizobium sp. NXC24 TaxID=2048897 RepID=UPI000CF22854|nr:hypothetical protein [Rhizobium sp. NXC24]
MADNPETKEAIVMLTEKIREDRVRRALKKRGMRLAKTPSRSWLRDYYGPGYMIIDTTLNAVVSGGSNRAYSDSLEDVEDFTFCG